MSQPKVYGKDQQTSSETQKVNILGFESHKSLLKLFNYEATARKLSQTMRKRRVAVVMDTET